MILEVAEIHIVPGKQAEFEAAVERGIASVFRRDSGARRIVLQRGLEDPARYLLLIEWDRLEDHTVGFRQSPLFGEWRALVGPFFAEAPRAQHFEQAVVSEG